jgi:hypothetical protein
MILPQEGSFTVARPDRQDCDQVGDPLAVSYVEPLANRMNAVTTNSSGSDGQSGRTTVTGGEAELMIPVIPGKSKKLLRPTE